MSASGSTKPTYPAGKFLEGPYAPIAEERVVEFEHMTVIGELPADLNGVYLRNGPNPRYAPVGRYHRYDGDGMVHSVQFDHGSATYRNRWIRTAPFVEEERTGHGIYHGMLGNGREVHPHMPVKDTSNTDIVLHAGKAITMWYLSGAAYQLDPVSLETQGAFSVGDDEPLVLSAHSKTDERTGDFVFFDYGREAPYMRYGVIDAQGTRTHFTPIELDGPRMPHDMWVSSNYSVLHDLPLVWDEDAYAAGRVKLKVEESWPARFGVIPRHGDGTSIRWYEFETCYVLHTINAWESGEWLHMDGCRIKPQSDALGQPVLSSIATIMGRHLLDAQPYRWSVNLVSGATREGPIDDAWNAEFPTWNNALMGGPLRYAYCTHIRHEPALHFAGLIKYDLDTGASEHYCDGDGFTYSEAPFAPADDATGEDHGYVVCFVRNHEAAQSEVHIFDAREIGRGPVCRLVLPCRVPEGFHATWARGDLLQRLPR